MLLFEIKGKYSYNPVSGNDRMNSGTVRIVWQTNENGGRIHAAVGEPIVGVPPPWSRLYANWRRKTLPDTGATPVISLNTSGEPLGLFTQPTSIQGVGFKKFFWSQDTGRFGFAALPGINPVEMRGGEVRNEQFTIGLAMGVYEDSTTGAYQEFVEVSDTTRLYSLTDFPAIVRTEDFTASRLRFDIRRWVQGFAAGVSTEVFDTESVTWHANIRNASNDTLVASIKLGGLEKDSSYIGIDSSFASFPRQTIYVQLLAEANPLVFPCHAWSGTSTVPGRMHEYSINKNTAGAHSHPSGVVLHPNVPNPFNPITKLAYSLNEDLPVRLSVHDLLGRELVVLVDGVRPSGRWEVLFDGSGLPSGTYLYRIQAGGSVHTRVMTLVR